MRHSLPNTYDQLAPLLSDADPAALKRLLTRRPNTLAELEFLPKMPATQPVSPAGIYQLIAGAAKQGVPVPEQTCFITRAGLRQLELVLGDDDRAAVTLYSLMFFTGLPRLSVGVLRAGLPGRFFTASHLVQEVERDEQAPAAMSFGGWQVTITCFAYDRPAAPAVSEVRW
jgi:hypothetical protein